MDDGVGSDQVLGNDIGPDQAADGIDTDPVTASVVPDLEADDVGPDQTGIWQGLEVVCVELIEEADIVTVVSWHRYDGNNVLGTTMYAGIYLSPMSEAVTRLRKHHTNTLR